MLLPQLTRMCGVAGFRGSATYLMRGFSSLSSPRSVVVVGAGQVGEACALGLLRHGHKVKVHDPSDRNRKSLEAEGATWVSGLEDVANQVGQHDVLVTALPAPPQVRDVMEGAGVLENLKAGSFWFDHTTTDPNEARRLHGQAKCRGVHSLEAPLTGGYQLLQAEMMTVLIGGDASVLDTAEPFLRNYTETILHMGDFGTANHVKIITNQLAAVHLVAAGEAVVMAKKGGVDLKAFFDGVRASAGNSYVFETETPLFFNGSFDPGFTIRLHCKDLAIGREIHGDYLPAGTDYDTAYRLNSLAEKMYIDTMRQYGTEVGSSFPGKYVQDGAQETIQYPGFHDWGYTIEKVTGGSIGVVHKNIEGEAGGSD